MSHFTDIPKKGDVVETIFPYKHYFYSGAVGILCCPFCGHKPDRSKFKTPFALECGAEWAFKDTTHVTISHPCNIVHTGAWFACIIPVGNKASCASKCCAFCGTLGSTAHKKCGAQYCWYNDTEIELEIPCPEILKGKIWAPSNSASPAIIADTAIKEYKSLSDIPKCTCKDVVNFGCKCGAMAAERKLLRVKKD
jgi:hypothetical protein